MYEPCPLPTAIPFATACQRRASPSKLRPLTSKLTLAISRPSYALGPDGNSACDERSDDGRFPKFVTSPQKLVPPLLALLLCCQVVGCRLLECILNIKTRMDKTDLLTDDGSITDLVASALAHTVDRWRISDLDVFASCSLRTYSALVSSLSHCLSPKASG